MFKNKSSRKFKYITLGLSLILLFFLVLPICVGNSHEHFQENNKNCLLGCSLTKSDISFYQFNISQFSNPLSVAFYYVTFIFFSLLIFTYLHYLSYLEYRPRSYLFEWISRGRLHPKTY
jgi:tellurite resistance protein TehA-like permease